MTIGLGRFDVPGTSAMPNGRETSGRGGLIWATGLGRTVPKTYTAEQAYAIRSSPSKVYRSLTDPNHLVRWFLSDAELDARPGGSFRFAWIGGYEMHGRVLRIAPGRSVTFLWRDKLPNGRMAETEASFRVVRKGRGTMLRLRHSGFRVPAHFAECASRWAYYLTNLKSVLDHGIDLRSPGDW